MGETILNWVKDVVLGLGKWILNGVISSSYWICLIICIGSLILYVGGRKESGKWMPISILIYYFLSCLRLVIK